MSSFTRPSASSPPGAGEPPMIRRRSLPSLLAPTTTLASKLSRRTSSSALSSSSTSSNSNQHQRSWYANAAGALWQRLPACGALSNIADDEVEEPYNHRDLFLHAEEDDDDDIAVNPLRSPKPTMTSRTSTAAAGLVSPCAVPSARCHSTPIRRVPPIASTIGGKPLVTPVNNNQDKTIKEDKILETDDYDDVSKTKTHRLLQQQQMVRPSFTFETATTATCDEWDTISTCSTQVTKNNGDAAAAIVRRLPSSPTSSNKRPSPHPQEHENKQRRRLQSPFRKARQDTNAGPLQKKTVADFPALVRMEAHHYLNDECRARATVTVLGGPLVFSDDSSDEDDDDDNENDIDDKENDHKQPPLTLLQNQPSLGPLQLPWLR